METLFCSLEAAAESKASPERPRNRCNRLPFNCHFSHSPYIIGSFCLFMNGSYEAQARFRRDVPAD